MRFLALLAALVLPATLPAADPAGAQSRRDWTTTVTPTAARAWVIGNPAAAVKLVEWGSYTCPHCAHFAAESREPLERRMIASGQVSFEVRHVIRDPIDFAAVAVARCGGPAGFVRRHHAIFDAQGAWLDKGAAYLQANGDALAKLPRPAAFRRIADNAGLTAIGRANGLTPAQLTACFTPPAQAALAKLGDAPKEVEGTPSFFVNGKPVTGADWASLQPVLAAAGAR